MKTIRDRLDDIGGSAPFGEEIEHLWNMQQKLMRYRLVNTVEYRLIEELALRLKAADMTTSKYDVDEQAYNEKTRRIAERLAQFRNEC